jgi:hypothetical protein
MNRLNSHAPEKSNGLTKRTAMRQNRRGIRRALNALELKFA